MNELLELRRVAYFPFGTYGIIAVPSAEFKCWTVELPWKNNHKMLSCIPEGTYDLVPHNSFDHPDTWAFVNHSLNVYHFEGSETPSDARTVCLLHPDNTPATIAGCVGMGKKLAMFSGLLGVTDSIDTYGILHNIIKLTPSPQMHIYSDFGGSW